MIKENDFSVDVTDYSDQKPYWEVYSSANGIEYDIYRKHITLENAVKSSEYLWSTNIKSIVVKVTKRTIKSGFFYPCQTDQNQTKPQSSPRLNNQARVNLLQTRADRGKFSNISHPRSINQ